MHTDQNQPVLKYEEAMQIAETITPRWKGLVGGSETPKVETVADLVQRIMQEADHVVRNRENDHG